VRGKHEKQLSDTTKNAVGRGIDVSTGCFFFTFFGGMSCTCSMAMTGHINHGRSKMAARSFGRQDYEYEEKDPSDRGNFFANHNSTPSQHQHNSHLGHQDHFSQDDDYRGEQEEEYIFTTSPTENEKSTSMVSLFDMRNDAAFCDVAFLVHGCLFRAHKVIVRSTNTSHNISFLLLLIITRLHWLARGAAGCMHCSQKDRSKKLYHWTFSPLRSLARSWITCMVNHWNLLYRFITYPTPNHRAHAHFLKTECRTNVQNYSSLRNETTRTKMLVILPFS
jgi:hypothetical protein